MDGVPVSRVIDMYVEITSDDNLTTKGGDDLQQRNELFEKQFGDLLAARTVDDDVYDCDRGRLQRTAVCLPKD